MDRVVIIRGAHYTRSWKVLADPVGSSVKILSSKRDPPTTGQQNQKDSSHQINKKKNFRWLNGNYDGIGWESSGQFTSFTLHEVRMPGGACSIRGDWRLQRLHAGFNGIFWPGNFVKTSLIRHTYALDDLRGKQLSLSVERPINTP